MFIFAHPVYLQGMRVSLYMKVKVKVTGAIKVKNAYHVM